VYEQRTGQKGAAGKTAAPAQPSLTDEQMQAFAEKCGLSAALVKAVPDLMQLARDSVAGSWTPENITAHLKNTNWWATTSDTQRKFIDLKTTDPATWRQQWESTAYRINQIAVQAGWSNLAGQGVGYDTMNGVLKMATTAVMQDGWSDDRIKSWLGSQIGYRQGQPLGGDAAANYDKLHSLAYSNGRDYADWWYSNWLQDLGSGRKTIGEAETQIRQEAAAQYSAFAPQITAGMNVTDLAAPYIQAASTLLELPNGALGLADKNVQKAMTGKQQDGSPYALWQFENDVRSDPRWKQTNNARDAAMKQARGVLSDFGFTY
jgi:hypothetical protein